MSARYDIKERIGRGGLGAVYRAYDTHLNREVAIKRVLAIDENSPDKMAEDLITEAKTLSTLKHPNIVTVHDVGEDEKGPFIVMELLEGETLDDIIARGTLELKDFEVLAVQAIEGLVAAQSVGLLHRDLKPANIMIVWLPSGKFQVKILDFGLARFAQKPTTQTVDHAGSILGSIYFMAPEQFERLPLDARTDLYSIGAIFYYALTGRYAFWGDTAVAVMGAHMNHSFTPLGELRPDVPGPVCAWVERLFARNMDDRPTNAQAALDAWNPQLVIDEAQLREVASGDAELAVELLDGFIEETSDLLKQLYGELEAGDGSAAAKTARTVRGTAATLGYTEIISIASSIEKKAVSDAAGCLIISEGFAPAVSRLQDAMGRLAWGSDAEGSEE